jgi:D-lactate dehydrogenase
VYEGESEFFFSDHSGDVIRDDVFARLLTFPNVLITGHQAFFTEEALTSIAQVTIGNITSFEKTGHATYVITNDKDAVG